MAKYKIVVTHFNGGLNELLNHQEKKWNFRTKKLKVYNTEKIKYEQKIIAGIKKSPLYRAGGLVTPIRIKYRIYAKNKQHDKMNIGSAFDKCFCDSLQKMHILSNDGWDEISDIRFEYYIDPRRPRVEVCLEDKR